MQRYFITVEEIEREREERRAERERLAADFEAWFCCHARPWYSDQRAIQDLLIADVNNGVCTYCNQAVQAQWEAWQAAMRVANELNKVAR